MISELEKYCINHSNSETQLLEEMKEFEQKLMGNKQKRLLIIRLKK